MNICWGPDPPGTVDPAKLAACTPPISGALSAPEAVHRHTPPAAPSPTPHSPIAPPLARISSDWDSKHDIVSRGNLEYQAIRKQFENSHTAKGRSNGTRSRHISHLGYFRRQTGGDPDTPLDIPVDPGAPPGAKVFVDKTSSSIYDIYLQRADISKNHNYFRRLQIVVHPDFSTYSLYAHDGDVGMKGSTKRVIESSANLKSVVAKFRSLFRKYTGLSWQRRYDTSCRSSWNWFMFIELDYTGTFVCPDIPNYETIVSGVTDELKDLMELMLYGGCMRKHDVNEESKKPKCCLPFSAPYKQLSAWSIYMGFKILEIIFKYLESARPFQWKAILTASSWYRSRIPFCAGHGRPPVISSYHALSLELKFLYSLHARREIALMLAKVTSRASIQLSTHKTLSQPLYQAYSSLRHGFRRLTDDSTTEFRALKEYLELSNHPTHHRKMELQEIYRVFVKRSLPNAYLDWIQSGQRDSACGENRLLLWHGTPLDSLLGILDLGLQIRRRGANFTGTMFGNGIYLADVSSKSAGYCKYESSGGEAIILLCEADTGTYRHECLTSMSNGHEIIEQSVGSRRCIQGMGRIRPAGWRQVDWDMGGGPLCTSHETVLMPDTSMPYTEHYSHGCLAFNEYVMYDPSHVLIRYLFRVKITRKY